MSSEIYNYIRSALNKKNRDSYNKFWKLEDDQKKAVAGICFIFGTLFIIGLFANLISI